MNKIYEVAINDTNYAKQKEEIFVDENGIKRRKVLWVCPFYRVWFDMLRRCFDKSYNKKHPSYKDCTVCQEWLTFSNFKKWMEKQDWQGKELDKDLLIKGNKVYSPETCVFISCQTNNFLLERSARRGVYPIGVHKTKEGKYMARCSNPFTREQSYLGIHDTASEAHQAWLKEKRRIALILADMQIDERVSEALRKRF